MGPPGTLKFIGSDDIGLPLKRKQVSEACDLCRKKKKRCVHTEEAGSGAVGSGQAARALRRRTAPSRKPVSREATLPRSPLSIDGGQGEDGGASEEAANQLVELSSRFVGDMNPEGVFLQAATPRLSATRSSYRDAADLGTFVPPAAAPTDGGGTASLVDSPRESVKTPANITSKSALRQHYELARQEYLAEECLKLLPPIGDLRTLKRIYREKVHPILPVLDDADLESDDTSTTFGVLTAQVVALAAATDPSASRHLRLCRDGPVLGFQEFHRALSTAIIAVLDADLLTHRTQLIRILVLLAFFFQPSTASERDRAALLHSQAVHHLVTPGAHLRGYRPQSEDENIDRLFCAVWALDRLFPSFYARPCLLHERDLDRPLDECIAAQPPCFRLFMRLVQHLDRVITLYRPRQPFVLIELPVLESLIMDTGTEKLPTPLLGTLEVLYHAVAVLSCRQPSSAFCDNPRPDDFRYMPPPTVNSRRSLSADRIVWVTQNQEMCPFPFVPYAVSLALTVEYRKMRYSRTAMFRNRARPIFKNIVGLLHTLGETFASARVNAGLGESILREMEKTASCLVRDETGNTTPSKRIESTAAENPKNGGEATEVPPPRAETGATATSGVLTPSTLNALNVTNAQFDPAILDNLDVDVDLFGYFDPSFDLGAIDTALEANLDMGIPQTWNTPWSYSI